VRPVIAVAAGALGLAALALPAHAGDTGFAIEGQYGYRDFTAAKSSAQAVFDGASGGALWGGGARYVFHSGIFFSAWARSLKKDGQRVYIPDASSPVFPLGHPLSVHLVPIQATIGFRATPRRSAFTPYAGIGAGVTKYHEESTVGGVTDTFDETKFSAHALAGLEIGRSSFRLAAEGGYTIVPNAVGIGGVSKIYDETGLGGFWVVGKVVFTTRR
jgi:opacity protein-like surface antigen